ncbi:MurR/RpiR family transcriptional regulator [Vagococcus entomophilus]|uniref:RpiR family transcriptional regulator n=1 Tax=Vagococcus entomophilus TaxID=1160095 RepID=A0A430AFU5_9ENTE|nr:MurR/RpiR family transcriptional regulator [Vagococcus entomophilus]RSU06606.1 hypothetical protein CBF30_10195 [Vagococcus entomophilus]
MSFFGFKGLDQLTDVELSVYQYMINNDSIIPFMRVREIALHTHTSPSSVMRLIKKMGYNSFPEFKLSFRNELLEQRTKKKNDFESRLQVLTPTLFPSRIEEKIKEVAETVMFGEHIVFLGMGASGSIAAYAARRLASIGINAFEVQDPTYPLATRLREEKRTVLIVLSVSGQTRELIELVNEFYQDKKSLIVIITSNPMSPLAHLSQTVLSYNLEKERLHVYYDHTSQIPCVFLIESILQEVRELQEIVNE